MPKLIGVPKYRLHKPSGNALVQIGGKRFYLGRYGTPESKARYSKLIAGLDSPDSTPDDHLSSPTQQTGGDLTVMELSAAYLEWAVRYYRNEESSMNRVRRVLKILKERFGRLPAKDFGPLALQAAQEHLVGGKVSRRYINHLTGGIKRVFRWGVSQQLIPPHVFQALDCVNGLRKGRSDARENPPIKAVDDEHVDMTLPHLPEHIADLVMLQKLTGARSGEIVLLRPIDIDRSVDPWIFTPLHHKTEYADKERKIFIGPKAQIILAKYLFREPEKYCFCPADYVREVHEERKIKRRSKPTPSQRHRRRKKNPQRAPGQHYTNHSFYYVIRRAIDVTNVERGKAGQSLIPLWTPHQLRHRTASEIRKIGGLEGAQVVLGHANARITEVYAEKDYALAADIMKRIG